MLYLTTPTRGHRLVTIGMTALLTATGLVSYVAQKSNQGLWLASEPVAGSILPDSRLVMPSALRSIDSPPWHVPSPAGPVAGRIDQPGPAATEMAALTRPGGEAEDASETGLRREKVVVRRGDTLMDILLRTGIGRAEAHEAVSTLQTLYDPRRLRAGQFLNIDLRDVTKPNDEPRLTSLSINLDFENDIKVARIAEGGFDVAKVERSFERTTHAASVVVEDSFYLAGKRSSVPDDALMKMIKLFSWDVDFQRDVQPGDRFELAYDVLASEDGQSRVDEILYAKLELGGEQLAAYRFVHDNGEVGYYDADGRSLRKWLMRTPIDGARMSSGFGKRRHPILGYNRMHKGVDFAAARGTPVYAAGDGTITLAGRNGTYGKYVRIRHNSEYSTAYAHLNGYAEGLKKGDRVKQGQIIGYVGSTGRSTGPHLHYEVLANGRQINPMQVKQQEVASLSGRELAELRQQIDRVVALGSSLTTAGRQFAERR